MRVDTLKTLFLCGLLTVSTACQQNGNSTDPSANDNNTGIDGSTNPSGNDTVGGNQNNTGGDNTTPQLNGDATLAGITLSLGSLDQTFSSDVTDYTVSVDSTVDSLTISAALNQATSSMWINGVSVDSGRDVDITLQAGDNPLLFLIVAEDGTQKRYNVTISRSVSSGGPTQGLSNNANLSDLSIAGVSLNQTFSADALTYSASVPNSTASISLNAIVADAAAGLAINSIGATSGTASDFALSVGNNPFNILVTAEDGTQKTYTLTITRADSSGTASTDASLSGLDVAGVTLTPAFSSNVLSYTATVANPIASVNISPILSDTNASYLINGVASNSVALSTGVNTIDVVVTAEDGTTTVTYGLDITRENPVVDSTPGSGTAVAIPMKYNVMKNRQKFVALSAYSDDITYLQAAFDILPIDFGVRYRDAITQWDVQSMPAHGTLYDGYNVISTVPHTVPDPDELLYVPDTDYVGADSFTFSVQDSTGTSNIGTISLVVENTPSMPAGIPDLPAIFHTPTPVPATTGDVETIDWYVDNTNVNATDTPRTGESNPRHGTPETPRATLPPSFSTFEPGAAVFIAGGVDTPYHLVVSGWHRWTVAGTAANPVYILGVNNGPNKPIIDHNFDVRATGTELRMEMQYAVIEGLHFIGKGFRQRDELATYNNGNIVMRHLIIDGANKGDAGTTLPLNIGDNKVLYDVHIKNAGRTEPDLAAENDVHGIQISNVSNYWIMDSLVHGSAGDAIQINGEFASNIYVGRNKLHSDNENALDFKRRHDFMFMENDVWDYRAITYGSSGSDGAPVIINQDTNGQTPTYSTIARNRIWDANTAVRHQGQYIWTTDNIFWHIHANSNSTLPGYALDVGNNAEADYHDRITNNIFHKVDGGIWLWAGDSAGVKDHVYSGNIFGEFNADSKQKSHYRISSNHIAGTVTDYNIYMTPLVMMWGTSSFAGAWDMATYRANTSNGTASLDNTDPLFVDAGLFNLRLQPTSPAIGANIEQLPYSEFNTQYGSSIKYDADLNARPVNGSWDIGPYDQ